MDEVNLEDYEVFLDAMVRLLDEQDLTHYGVKGMKWGVRRAERSAAKNAAIGLTGLGPASVTKTTKNGETLTLVKDPPGAIARFMAKRSESMKEYTNNTAYLTIKNAEGKKVGDAALRKEGDKLNLVWLGIKKSERGNGYASACMQAAEEFGRSVGVDRMTLEVPGNSPDARHIYTNLGFRVTREATPEEIKADSYWGGLTEMEYVFATDAEMRQSAGSIFATNYLAHKESVMSTVTIVALPEAEERVNKISSEKQAHLTLLHLGEIPDEQLADLTLYVQHAAEQFHPFYMTVDYRDTLGDKQADVLFFEKDSWGFPEVGKFRNDLLLNDAIKRGFDTSDQFPDWTPHLTLGYPDAPARVLEGDEDRKIYMVSFDRIAVWVADSDGPTFRLKHEESMMTDTLNHAALGETFAARFLKHYGKKGMKWGVRNDKGHEGEVVKTKKLEKLDSKWEKSVYSNQGAMKVHNAMAEHFNSRIGAINDKHPNADIFDKPDSPESVAYMKDVNALDRAAYSKAVNSVHGVNPSGTKKAVYVIDENGARIEMRDNEIKHSDEPTETEPDLVVLLKVSEGGHILAANEAEMALEHSDSENFLKHFGVKGMRWGVRKSEGGGGEGGGGERGKIRRGITKANTALDAGGQVIKKGEEKLIFLPKEKREQAATNTQARVLDAAREVNKSEQFRGKDIKKNPELKAAYHEQVKTRALDIYKEELTVARVEAAADLVKSLFPEVSPDGTRMTVTVPKDSLRHSAEDDDTREVLLILDFGLDSSGKIDKVSIPAAELKHYGVKGMRWGVTKKDRAAETAPQEVTATQKKPGEFVKTTGGQNQPAHQDAIAARVAVQKAKASTTDSLSNSELRSAVDRMRLEQQYSQLAYQNDRRSAGKRFVDGLFGNSRYKNGEMPKYRDIDEENGRKVADAIREARERAAASSTS